MQHGVSISSTRDQHRQRHGSNRKQDGCPGRHLCEQVGGSAWSKGGLRTLPAECASQVGTLTGLQQDNSDQNETNNNVQDGEKRDHCIHFRYEKTYCARTRRTATSRKTIFTKNHWCGRGDLNPHASRRHPLKMVCLPFHHFRMDILRESPTPTIPSPCIAAQLCEHSGQLCKSVQMQAVLAVGSIAHGFMFQHPGVRMGKKNGVQASL